MKLMKRRGKKLSHGLAPTKKSKASVSKQLTSTQALFFLVGISNYRQVFAIIIILSKFFPAKRVLIYRKLFHNQRVLHIISFPFFEITRYYYVKYQIVIKTSEMIPEICLQFKLNLVGNERGK